MKAFADGWPKDVIGLSLKYRISPDVVSEAGYVVEQYERRMTPPDILAIADRYGMPAYLMMADFKDATKTDQRLQAVVRQQVEDIVEMVEGRREGAKAIKKPYNPIPKETIGWTPDPTCSRDIDAILKRNRA